MALEHAARELANDVLVLDEQDRLRARQRCRLGRGRMRRGRFEDPRQPDGEHRAGAGGALDGHLAAALVDDPVHGREAEADALVASREERLEDPRERLLVHADARVGDDELDGAVVGVARRDRQPAAVRHRVAGVHGEVDDHLLDLARVGTDDPEVRRREELELDVVAEQPLEEPTDLGEHRVQVERARLQHLPPPEREQLLRQLGCPVGGTLDLAQVARQLRVVRSRARAAATHSP